MIDYLEKAKSLTMQTKVMKVINRLIIKIERSHEKIEENTTIIRNQIADIATISSSSLFAALVALKT